MKAIQVLSGEPDRPLVWQETPDPVWSPDDVLVDVHATALNRADLMQREGNYPPPPGASEILGLDMAGMIAQTGANVRGWRPGDRVCALLPGGGYAERAVAPAGMLMPVPPDWSLEEAAALPEVFLTAFVNLFREASFQQGETVLVHGGASGVGTAAIQLAHAAGGRVIATAGSDEKVERCRTLGADLAINYRRDDFAARAGEFTGGAGVDIIIDMVAAPYLEANLGLLRRQGRLILISTLGGTRAEINLGLVLGRRLRLIGSTLRGRPVAEKIALTHAFLDRFGPALQAGTIRPVIDRIYPIQEAAEAHARMAANENIGKIVLKVR